MKRALLFAPYFLPRRRVGSMRPFRFAIHLKEFGWAPTVVTIKAKGQQLTPKEARLLEEVDIIELDPPFDRTVSAESQLGLNAEEKTVDTEETLSPSTSRTSFLDVLDRQFPVDTWLPFFALKWRRLKHVMERVQPDVMWSTGDPWSSLVVARQLARQYDVPWVADFRDPWTLCDVRSEGLWPVTQAANRYFERRVLETADTVLFQAKQTEQVYRRHYADLGLETSTIYNSYDPDVFDDPVALETEVAPVAPGDGLRVGFFGRFRAMSPAALVTDALAEVRRKHGAAAGQITVHSFGPLNGDDARYAEERGVLENFRREEAVALEEALGALREFDILLLSTDPRRDEIIPAKLLEYLAAGRPILSLSRNPEVARILSRTGTGKQLDAEDPGSIADVLAESLRAKKKGRAGPIPFNPVHDEVRRFGARATTEELAAFFEATKALSSGRKIVQDCF